MQNKREFIRHHATEMLSLPLLWVESLSQINPDEWLIILGRSADDHLTYFFQIVSMRKMGSTHYRHQTVDIWFIHQQTARHGWSQQPGTPERKALWSEIPVCSTRHHESAVCLNNEQIYRFHSRAARLQHGTRQWLQICTIPQASLTHSLDNWILFNNCGNHND